MKTCSKFVGLALLPALLGFFENQVTNPSLMILIFLLVQYQLHALYALLICNHYLKFYTCSFSNLLKSQNKGTQVWISSESEPKNLVFIVKWFTMNIWKHLTRKYAIYQCFTDSDKWLFAIYKTSYGCDHTSTYALGPIRKKLVCNRWYFKFCYSTKVQWIVFLNSEYYNMMDQYGSTIKNIYTYLKI